MKTLYILLNFFLISFIGVSQNVTITKVFATNCPNPYVRSVELYVDGTVDFTSPNVVFNFMLNGAAWAVQDISALGTVTDSFVYLVRDIPLMAAEFPSTTFTQNVNTVVVGFSTNGDDGFQVVLNGNVVSQFGESGVDGTGTGWDHALGVASRKSGIPDLGVWNINDWEFSTVGALDGQTACTSGGSTNLETYFANTLGGTFPLGSGSGWTPNGATCTTVLGSTSVSCDTTMSGATDDTYTATLDFSGGDNGNTFVVISTAGTVGGDNPSSVANGTITITGITEGTDITVTVSDTGDGGFCNLSTDIDSPGCIPLLINEILFDPAGAAETDLEGDANGDGVRNNLDDEFIEFYNSSSATLDISGYTVSDGAALRHTFPASTIIPANKFLVVFGGGTPTGSFGGSIVQIASEGQLNLSNAGDVITIENPSGDVVLTYGSSDTGINHGSNESVTRSPDFTGNFVLHTNANASLLFSPGLKVDGTTLSTGNFLRNELSIYPNPTNGFVNIKTPLSGVKNIQLYDIMGRRVLSTKLNSDVLDVSSVNSGLYLLRISIDDRSSTTKLIIE